jgi:hypothetical protein
MNKMEDEDESACSSSSNLFEQIPNDMAIHGAFADDSDVAAFVGGRPYQETYKEQKSTGKNIHIQKIHMHAFANGYL